MTAEYTTQVKPTRARVALRELTLIVRVDGQPAAVRTFTADQAREAQAYADQHGSTVETMPA